MKIIMIFGHPKMEESYVSKTWYQQVMHALPDIYLHSLSELYPSGEFDITAEQNLVKNFDRIIFVYPVYWFDTPWLMQKWLEEVFVHPFYAKEEAMLGKELQIALSTGSMGEYYRLGGLNDYSLDMFLLKMQAITHKCRMRYRPHYAFYNAGSSDIFTRLEAEKEHFFRWITQT